MLHFDRTSASVVIFIAQLTMIFYIISFSTKSLGKGEGQIDDPVLKEKFLDAAKELRCPTCTGLSVLESDAEFSVQIKQQVKEQVTAGKTTEEIRSYFVQRYGPWILREPPNHGFNAFAWIFPIGILILGPIIMWILIWRRRKLVNTFGARSAAAITEEFQQLIQAARAKGAGK